MRLPVVIDASCFVSSTGGHNCEANSLTMRWARSGAGLASLKPASSTPPPDQMDRFGRQALVMRTRVGVRRSASVSIVQMSQCESSATRCLAKSIRLYPCLAASTAAYNQQTLLCFCAAHDACHTSARLVELASSKILAISTARAGAASLAAADTNHSARVGAAASLRRRSDARWSTARSSPST